MTFDDLVARLVSLYDVGTVRAAQVANERLARMTAAAKSIKTIASLGTTVAGQAAYPIPAYVVQIDRVRVAYTSGIVDFEGTEDLLAIWDLEAGNAYGCGNYYVIEADADASGTTDNLRLYPVPTEAGAAITGLVAITPDVVTYGTGSALPIPLDCHEHLLAGCKAELLDEDSRQDESSKLEVVFETGVKRLAARENSRGKGSDGHRLRMAGYDFSR